MSELKEKILYELGFTYAGLSGKTQKDFGRGKPFIPFMNIMSNGKIDPKFLNYVDVASNENQNAVQIGDLFFTTSSETPEEVGMTSVLLEDIGVCYLNSFCFGFRLYNFDDLLPEFAPYLFRGNEVRKQIINLGQGYTRFNLPKTELLKKLKLNLPSIPEQRKISKILTTADSIIEKTQATIAKYKVIKLGILQDLFTRGIDININKLRPLCEDAPHLYKESKLGWIPIEWEVDKMEKYVSFLRSGLSRLLSDEDIGIPVLISGNIQESHLDCTNLKYWYLDDPQGADTNSYKLTIGDILICFINSLDQIGKSAIFEGFKRDVIYTTNLLRMQASKNTNSRFLFFLLNSSIIQNELHTIVKPAVNQASFTTKDFLKIPVPKIPENEQNIIAEKLTSIDKTIDTEQTYLQKMQLLKKGLMEDLLSGKKKVKVAEELVTQNEN
ncbi:MAG: restriction endonuclease subunit S [Bacteroidota bacterium]